MIRALLDSLHLDNPTTWLFACSGLFIAASFAARQMLLLRTLTIVAYGFSIAANARLGLPLMWIANLGVIGINLFQIGRLVLDRKPVTLPEELRSIYSDRFAAMTTREFTQWLKLGEALDAAEHVFCQRGGVAEHLYLIVSGTAEVRLEGGEVATLGAGDLIGEMSFFAGRAYSADVVGRGAVRFIRWRQSRIAALKQEKPLFSIKVIAALGGDLVRKLEAEKEDVEGAEGRIHETLKGVGGVGWWPRRLV